MKNAVPLSEGLWYPDLAAKALTDISWRTMTALGRKVASSIQVNKVGSLQPDLEIANCTRCGELRNLHHDVCEPCIDVDAEDAMNYEMIEERYF